MTHQGNQCAKLDAYFDGELNGAERLAYEEHLEGCEACRTTLKRLQALADSIRETFELKVPDPSDLRIRRRLHEDLADDEQLNAVMDLEGLARYLQLPVAELSTMLDEIPSFELAGRLRFRRERIDEWLRVREQRMQWERAEFTRKAHTKIIAFPGGRQ